jgi:SSS family solute:Na+ symporter
MSPTATALAGLFGIVAAGAVLGATMARGRQLDLEQWAVAGRGLGLVLVWILQAGEIFTTFSVLGISGWIYAKGGPTLYVLAYLILAYIVYFFVGPPIWEAGRRHGLQTLGDFFARAYGSRALTALVTLAGVVFLMLYLQLQLTGLGIIVSLASFDAIPARVAAAVSAAAVAAFVLACGVRGVAWVSALKDFLLVAVALVLGLGLPWLRFGGVGPMFAALLRAHPGHLTMPGGTPNYDHTWYVTTVLVNCSLFAWPHFFASTFTARSAETVRRNAVLMPLYVVPLALMFLAGCAALLLVPGLKNGDLALLTAVRTTFPPWLLGLVGGAGALTALVPASMQVLSASTLLAKNFIRPCFAPRLTEEGVGRVAHGAVPLVAAATLVLSLYFSTTLVGLLLLAYSGVCQFGPGIVLGLGWKRVSTAGILTGLVVGLMVTGAFIFTHHDPFHGLNAGFIGLACNVLVAVGLSLAVPRPAPGFDAPVRAAA